MRERDVPISKIFFQYIQITIHQSVRFHSNVQKKTVSVDICAIIKLIYQEPRSKWK